MVLYLVDYFRWKNKSNKQNPYSIYKKSISFSLLFYLFHKNFLVENKCRSAFHYIAFMYIMKHVSLYLVSHYVGVIDYIKRANKNCCLTMSIKTSCLTKQSNRWSVPSIKTSSCLTKQSNRWSGGLDMFPSPQVQGSWKYWLARTNIFNALSFYCWAWVPSEMEPSPIL